jgi:sugar lactone lactonase YvrE
VCVGAGSAYAQHRIDTWLGGGPDGVPPILAPLNQPYQGVVGPDGSLYVAVPFADRVFRVADGVLTVFAGHGVRQFDGDGGPAVRAGFQEPSSIGFDGAGNLYICDQFSHRIRRVDAATGVVTTLAGTTNGYAGDGGPATAARLLSPVSIAVDAAGDVFVADTGNHRIRRIDAATGVITTVAGNGTSPSPYPAFDGDGGPAADAIVTSPQAVALDAAGNLFIAARNRIRRVDAVTGVITTVAGSGLNGFAGDGGPATDARFSFVAGVAVDGAGDLFVSDQNNHRIRRVDAATGIITTVVGTGVASPFNEDVPGTAANINAPVQLSVAPNGDLYFGDRFAFRLRKLAVETGHVVTVAGSGSNNGFLPDGYGRLQTPAAPQYTARDAAGNLYYADSTGNLVRRVDAITGVVTTVAGNGRGAFGAPALVDGTPATGYPVGSPGPLLVDGDWLYVTQNAFGSCRIFKVNLQTGGLWFVAGASGNSPSNLPSTASTVVFQPLTGLVVDAQGNVYYAMSGGAGVVRVDAVTGVVARTPGYFGNASGLAWDGPGRLIVSESTGRKIIGLDLATGQTTPLAGTGQGGFAGDGGPATAARFGKLDQVAVDACGNVVVADPENGRVRRVDARTGIVSTITGQGTGDIFGPPPLRFLGDGGPAALASINFVRGVTLGDDGELFLSDPANFRVRRVDNQVPVADAGPDQTLECTSPAGAPATLSAAGSSDADGDPLAFTWGDGAGPLGAGAQITPVLTLGTHDVSVVAADDWCAEAADEVVVRVVDTTAPALDDVGVSRAVLWPPNHKMRDVRVDWTASDTCLPFDVTLDVWSDDPGDGEGDGNTTPDWVVVDNHHLSLRAERAGNDGDRIYWIAVTATDAAGNARTELTTVVVPHDVQH